ncbi:MAG: ABC transporter permease [Acidobacteriota bacterium]|jgi:ABC-2 type transport system permease protein
MIGSKLWAFFYRDFLNELSYRTAFLLQITGSFLFVTTWFFVSRFVARAFEAPPDLPGVSYFSFVLVGFAFYQYLNATLTSFSAKIRREQLTGTLEAMLVTPTPASLVVLGSTVWDFLMTTFRVAVVLVLGSALAWGFGTEVGLKAAGIPAFLVLLALTVASFTGIGVLSASFTIWLKRGDPVNYLITALSALLGGVFFQVEVMPGWLQHLAALLPITHALRGIRRALLAGAGLREVSTEIQVLLLFTAVLLPLGLAAFALALRRARVEGSLVQY